MSGETDAALLRCEEGAVAGACQWCGVARQGECVQTVWLGAQRAGPRGPSPGAYQRYDHYGCPARLRDALQDAANGQQAWRLMNERTVAALRAERKTADERGARLLREAWFATIWAVFATLFALYYGWKPLIVKLLGVL